MDSIRFVLSYSPCNTSEVGLSLHVFDDRPRLSIRLLDSSKAFRTGDTIDVEISNPSATESVAMATNHWGMRQLDDYIVDLGPRESKTAKWIVVASTGGIAWIELSWGSYGQSRRIDFTIL